MKFVVNGKSYSNQNLLIIAEMANAHGGDPTRAKEIIKAAADSGADAIKIQRILIDEIALPGYTFYEALKKCEFTFEVWQELISYAKSLGLLVFADVFGLLSLEEMHECDVDGFEIHASDINNTPLLREVTKKGKSILLYAGGATRDDITYAISIIERHCYMPALALVHGFQNFPTKMEDIQLSRVSTLQTEYGLPVGFAGHLAGDDPLAIYYPFMAIGAGAVIIEKHLTYDRSAKDIDYYSSLNSVEFKEMVTHIRRCEKSLGSTSNLTEAEERYRKLMRKHLVTKSELSSGHQITENDVSYLRTEQELPFLLYEEVVGKKVQTNLKPNQVILREHLDD
jgi:N,N'-diacetyllegionaminate synthase